MLCSISGTVPEEPVVSKKSGLVFEKRLIEKVVQDTGRCPITDEVLEKDDLLPLQSSKALKPRTLPATSIPGLLSLFQNEWDASMLEMHQLRQALQSSRQELSHALYQHDAATRVIARLLREKDAMRVQLENVQKAAPAAAAAITATGEAASGKRAADSTAAAEEPAVKKAKGGLPSAVTDAMTARSNELSKGRKKRAISPTNATPEDIAGYTLLSSQPLHQTTKGGILSIDIAPGSEDGAAVVATAGVDGTIRVFDQKSSQVLGLLKGHSKKVNDAKFIGSTDVIASASADKTVKLWRAADGGKYTEAASLTNQNGDMVALCVHPTNDYILTASGDGTWAMYDVAQAECLTKVNAQEESAVSLTSAALHPDGLILATGDEAAGLKVWETRTQKSVAQFAGHTGAINSISFSENGYHMATAAVDGVKLWDLRKLKNFQTLTPYPAGTAATAVRFDQSGLFLGVGGADARVYGVKQDWAVVKEFTEVPKKGVYSLAFGADAKTLFVGGSDHQLRVFGASA